MGRPRTLRVYEGPSCVKCDSTIRYYSNKKCVECDRRHRLKLVAARAEIRLEKQRQAMAKLSSPADLRISEGHYAVDEFSFLAITGLRVERPAEDRSDIVPSVLPASAEMRS